MTVPMFTFCEAMMTPRVPARDITNGVPEFSSLTDIGDLLSRHGRSASFAGWSVCGETDQRLLIRGTKNGPDVELLGPYEGVAPASRWHAVQIWLGIRLVWAGPPCACAELELLSFIEDLLRPDCGGDDLASRWRRLG